MHNPAKLFRRVLVGVKLRKMQKAVETGQREVAQRSHLVREYNERMRAKRAELEQRVKALYLQIDSEEMVELYLIYFSAVGSKMVAPADSWLTRWGNGLKRLGFESIGAHIVEHAKEEIGHDRWHENDVKFLVSHFNKKYGASLNVTEILNQGNSACVRRYQEAYDSTVQGDTEYQAFGLLYETELMTFTLAPKFIGFCVQELGFEIMRGLSFLRGHMVSDVGHVKENAEQLEEILNGTSPSQQQQRLLEIIRVGEETVNVYIDYFEQVFQLAKERQQARSLVSEKKAA